MFSYILPAYCFCVSDPFPNTQTSKANCVRTMEILDIGEM